MWIQVDCELDQKCYPRSPSSSYNKDHVPSFGIHHKASSKKKLDSRPRPTHFFGPPHEKILFIIWVLKSNLTGIQPNLLGIQPNLLGIQQNLLGIRPFLPATKSR